MAFRLYIQAGTDDFTLRVIRDYFVDDYKEIKMFKLEDGEYCLQIERAMKKKAGVIAEEVCKMAGFVVDREYIRGRTPVMQAGFRSYRIAVQAMTEYIESICSMSEAGYVGEKRNVLHVTKRLILHATLCALASGEVTQQDLDLGSD